MANCFQLWLGFASWTLLPHLYSDTSRGTHFSLTSGEDIKTHFLIKGSTLTDIHKYTYIHTYNIHINTCICIFIYTCIYIYNVCMYIHIFIYMYLIFIHSVMLAAIYGKKWRSLIIIKMFYDRIQQIQGFISLSIDKPNKWPVYYVYSSLPLAYTQPPQYDSSSNITLRSILVTSFSWPLYPHP
jgi:hypothetical protein